MEHRPGLDPAVAEVRRAVRAGLDAVEAIDPIAGEVGPSVVVALSGGADSLALAAAVAFEAPRRSIRVTAVVVDHGLQPGSPETAAAAVEAARSLGLAGRAVAVRVGSDGGVEAAARDARYRALISAARAEQARAVLVAHTLDDQAETVLLGLARGSGAASLQGMPVVGEFEALTK